MAFDPLLFQRRLRSVDQRITDDDARRACGAAGLGAIVTSGNDPRLVRLVETCGQNACFTCADRGLKKRRAEIQARVEHWMANGLTVLGVTFTVPHRTSDDVHDVRDWLDAAQRGLFANGHGAALREELRVGPIDKTWETTYSIENGPHPHIHAQFYMKYSATDADVAEFTASLRARWTALVRKTIAPIWAGKEAALEARGVHVAVVESPGAAARYLTKSTVERDAHGEPRATGLFSVLQRLAEHQDALGMPCYCADCKRHAAVWKALTEVRDPETLPDGAPRAHAGRYTGRPRYSAARGFDRACELVGLPPLSPGTDTDPDTGACRVRYDALRVLQEQAAEDLLLDAVAKGGLDAARAVVATCYEHSGESPVRATLLASIQVTPPPPWSRRIGFGSEIDGSSARSRPAPTLTPPRTPRLPSRRALPPEASPRHPHRLPNLTRPRSRS